MGEVLGDLAALRDHRLRPEAPGAVRGAHERACEHAEEADALGLFLEADELHDEVAELVERSDGIPFFIEELLALGSNLRDVPWIDRSDAVAVVYVDLRQPDRLYGLRRSFPPHCRDDDPGSTGEEMWMTMVEPIGGASVVWSNGVLWHGHVQGVSWLQEGHDEN